MNQSAIQLSADDWVFVLTGAGISAESGIPTFRGVGGVWKDYRIEDVASPAAWRRDPQMVWEFYSWRRETALPCKPNAAHFALAELEKKIGERLFVCTQNVDSLHEQAGSRRVVHMHGYLFQSRCDRECGRAPREDTNAYRTLAEIPRCPCGGMMRPHICWFGEVPFHLDEISAALNRCTVFLCVGSSGVVEPAASFVRQARWRAGTRAYYVGPEEPANREAFDQCFWGKAAELLPGLFRTRVE